MTGSVFVRCGFILCMLGHSVHSRGYIETNFKEFINYEGKRFDGKCCDKPGFWSWGASKDKCTDECDHTFVICMGNGTQSSSMSACEFGQQELEGVGGNRIIFNSHVGNAVNPVKFAFVTWPGVVKVKIDVHDNDGDDGYDFVDHFEYQYNTRDLRREIDAAQESLVLTGTRTRFDLELKVYCDINFYGPNCDIFCKETDDATGHFKCDPSTGAKICKSGWKGSDCLENIDDCVGNRCYPGSSCIDGINYYSCLCPPGRTGFTCEAEINECASSPCLNGGKCMDESNGFSCMCATGFAGLLCDVEIDECRSGPCLNEGSCEDKIASYSCSCRSGFQGDRCEIDLNECLSNPCYQAERCVDLPGDYRCECLPGFSGKNCEYNINECSSRPCQNNGLCIDELNAFRCRCEYGFTGIMCEERVNFCDPNYCKNGATCTSLDADFECECLDGFTGTWCELDINECEEERDQCGRNGKCVNTVGSFYCDCVRGYDGIFCENEIDECNKTEEPCLNDGLCINMVGKYRCECNGTGFQGNRCEVDVNECEGKCDICGLNGKCVNTNGSYNCDCFRGYDGIFCENEIDECNKTEEPCLNDGLCINMVGKYRCECNGTGFQGNRCEVDVNECEGKGDICGLNGKCVNTNGSYNCDCFRGYDGIFCENEIDECNKTEEPCLNDGLCVDMVGEYRCECGGTGFQGNRCEVKINECESSPCDNGGVCVDMFNGFKCVCPLGFSGETCAHSFTTTPSTLIPSSTPVTKTTKTSEPNITTDMFNETMLSLVTSTFHVNVTTDIFQQNITTDSKYYETVTATESTHVSLDIKSLNDSFTTEDEFPLSTTIPEDQEYNRSESTEELSFNQTYSSISRDTTTPEYRPNDADTETKDYQLLIYMKNTTDYTFTSSTSNIIEYLSTGVPFEQTTYPESEIAVKTTKYPTLVGINATTKYEIEKDANDTQEYPSSGDVIITVEYPSSGDDIETVEYPSSGDGIETVEYPSSGDDIETVEYPSSGDGIETVDYPSSGDVIETVEYPSSGDGIETVEYPSSGDGIETVEYPSSGDNIETVEYPSSGDGIETVEYPSAGDVIETVEYPSSGDVIETVEYPSSGDVIETVEYPSSGDGIETVEYPSSGDDIETVEYPSSGDVIETVEHASSGDVIETVEYPSSGDVIETVEYPSSGDDIETVEYPSTGDGIETVEHPSSGDGIKTVEYPSSGDGIETVEHPSSGDGIETVEYPSSGDGIETVEYPSSGDVIETVEHPSSGEGIEAVEYPSSGDGIETVEYPSSGDGIETVEYPSSGDDIETVEYLSSGDGIETVEYPSSGDGIETVEYPSSGDDIETVEYPSSGDGIETVEYPSSGDGIETVEHPSSGDGIETVEHPSSGDGIETVEYPSSGDGIETVEYPSSGDGIETVEYPSSGDGIETVEHPSSGDGIETLEYPSSGDVIETVEYTSSLDAIDSSTHTIKVKTTPILDNTFGRDSNASLNITDTMQTTDYNIWTSSVQTVNEDMNKVTFEYIEYNIDSSGEDSYIEYQTERPKSSTESLPSSAMSSSSHFLGTTTDIDQEHTYSSQSIESSKGSVEKPDTPLDSLESYNISTTERTETLNETTLMASSETTAIYKYLFTSTHDIHSIDFATTEVDSADTVTSGINVTKTEKFFKSPSQTTLTSENTTLSRDNKTLTRTEYDFMTTLKKHATTFKPDTIGTSYSVSTNKLKEVVPTTSKVSTEISTQISGVTEKTKESVLNPWVAARKHLQTTSSPITAVPTKERLNPRNPWIAARKHLGRMGPSTEVSAKTSRTKQSEVTIPSTLPHSHSDLDISTARMTGRVSLGDLTTDEETTVEFPTYTDWVEKTESKSDEPYPGMVSHVEATSSSEKDKISSSTTLSWPFDVTFSSTLSLNHITTDFDLKVERTSTVYNDHTTAEATKIKDIDPQHSTKMIKMSSQATTKTTALMSDITNTGVTEQVSTASDPSYTFYQSELVIETTTPQQFPKETYNTAENAYTQFETTDSSEKSTVNETTLRESNYTETTNTFETDFLSSTGDNLATDITSTDNTTSYSRSLSSDKTVSTSIKQGNRTVTTESTKSTLPFLCNKCGLIPTIPHPEMTKAIEIYDVLLDDFLPENETKGMTDKLETMLSTFLKIKTTFPTVITERSTSASTLENVTIFPQKDITDAQKESKTIDRETSSAGKEIITSTLEANLDSTISSSNVSTESVQSQSHVLKSKPTAPGVETDNQYKLSSTTSLPDMTYSLISSVASPKQTVDTRTIPSTLFTNVSSSASETKVSLSEMTDINMKSSTTVKSEEIVNLKESKQFSVLSTPAYSSAVSSHTTPPTSLFVSLTTRTFYEDDSKSVITETDFTEDSMSTTPLSTKDESASTGAYSSPYETSTLLSSTTHSTSPSSESIPSATDSTLTIAILSSVAETKLLSSVLSSTDVILPEALSTQSATEISPEATKSTSKIIIQTVNTETRSTDAEMSSILGADSDRSIKSSTTTREESLTSLSDLENQTQTTATFVDTGAYFISYSESDITELYVTSAAATEADEIKYLTKSEPVSSLSTTASSASSETTTPSSLLTLLTTETVSEYDTKRINSTSIKPATTTREESETSASDMETQTQLLKTTATIDDTERTYETSSESETTEIYVTSAAATEAHEIKYLTTSEPFPILSITVSSASSETTTLSSSLTLLKGTKEYDTKSIIQDTDLTGDPITPLNLTTMAKNASARVDFSTFISKTSQAESTSTLEYTTSATLQSSAESKPTALVSAVDSTLPGRTSAPSVLDILSKATTSAPRPESLSPAIDTEAVSFSSSFATEHASIPPSLSENKVIINAINETLYDDDLLLMRILTEPRDLGTTKLTPHVTEVPVKLTTESRKTKKTKSTGAKKKPTTKFISSTSRIYDASSLRHQSYYTTEQTFSGIVTTSIAKTQPEDTDLPIHAGFTTTYAVKKQPDEMTSVPHRVENFTSEYTTEASTAYIKGGAIKLSISENQKYREQTTFLPTVTTIEPTTRKMSVIRHEVDLTSNNTYPHPRKEIFEYVREDNITKGAAKLTFQKIKVTVIRAYDAGKQVVLQTYQKVKDIATTVVVTTYKRSRELLEKALYRIEALWKYCTEGIDHYIVQPLLNAKVFVKHKFDQTYANLSKLFETGKEILKRTAEDTRKETLTYFDTLTEYYTDVYRQYSTEVRDIFESLKIP